MTMRNDQAPDYIARRATRGRFSEALLVEGALCAVALGLMVLMPAIAAEAPPSPPVQAGFRVCTPALLPVDGETGAEPARSMAPRPPCGAPARAMQLVEEAIHPESEGASARP